MWFGVLFIAAAVFEPSMRQSETWYDRDRFQKDNAYGATANAVERLAVDTEWPRSLELFTIGLVLLLFARLGHVADVLEAIHAQLERGPPRNPPREPGA